MKKLTLLMILALAATALRAEESRRPAAWERTLGAQEELLEQVRAVKESLAAGDIDGVSGLFAPGRVGLRLRSSLPDGSYSHSQAKAVLRDFFRDRGERRVRISRAVPFAETRAVVVYEILQPSSLKQRAVWESFVCSFSLFEGRWLLSDLRGP